MYANEDVDPQSHWGLPPRDPPSEFARSKYLERGHVNHRRLAFQRARRRNRHTKFEDDEFQKMCLESRVSVPRHDLTWLRVAIRFLLIKSHERAEEMSLRQTGSMANVIVINYTSRVHRTTNLTWKRPISQGSLMRASVNKLVCKAHPSNNNRRRE